MELSVVELSKSLGVSPDTVERWIRQGKLPVSRKGKIYRVKTSELKKWASSNNIRLDLSKKSDSKPSSSQEVSLAEAIENGGVYIDVGGRDVESVLAESVGRMTGIPEAHKTVFLEQLIERESALSTGIGKGVAIPHPRQPQTYLDKPLVSICFLKSAVDYKALDDQLVTVLFIIVCPELKMHLQLLSAISFCLKDSAFVRLLETSPDAPTIIRAIENSGTIRTD